MIASEKSATLQLRSPVEDRVTFVLTSCGRLDLLEQTVASFFAYNTYPIEKYIIIEDSGSQETKRELEKKYSERFEIIFNEPKLGQIRSIDKAYARVSTPYIFHCEDDWEFYRRGFIEDSISILKTDPKIIQVWLRDFADTNGHPIEDQALITAENVRYRRLARDYAMQRGGKTIYWHGFSFNPGVKRKCDYERIGTYSRVGEREVEINWKYRTLGYYATILENSAVKHIGWGRHLKIHQSRAAKIKTLAKKAFTRLHLLVRGKRKLFN